MAKILYFGSLPDLIGRGEEEFHLPKNVKDVQGLLDYLGKRGETWQRGLAPERVRITVNKAFAEPDTAISDDDEIAIVSISLR